MPRMSKLERLQKAHIQAYAKYRHAQMALTIYVNGIVDPPIARPTKKRKA